MRDFYEEFNNLFIKEKEICRYYVQIFIEQCKKYRKSAIRNEYLEKSIYIEFTKGCFFTKKKNASLLRDAF